MDIVILDRGGIVGMLVLILLLFLHLCLNTTRHTHTAQVGGGRVLLAPEYEQTFIEKHCFDHLSLLAWYKADELKHFFLSLSPGPGAIKNMIISRAENDPSVLTIT